MLRWCAVPTITNMNMSIAGIDFTCCPFNGWFLDLEITRNLFDRYDAVESMLPCFPDLLKRKENNDSSYVDACFLELNRAVLHSFQKERMSMVDRATLSKQFKTHCARELEVRIQYIWRIAFF